MVYKVKKYQWGKFSFYKLRKDQVPMSVTKGFMKFIKKIDIKGKSVIDGGSNIGLYSLYFSSLVGKRGTVHAFEIQPVICSIGRENAKLNKKTNIIFHNVALSNKSKRKVGFTYIDYFGENISSGGIRTEPALSGERHCGKIQTMAVDDMKIENVALIKLDIEGSEPKALDGMWKTIDRCKPYLIVELSPGYLLDGEDQEVIEKIKAHGYSVSSGDDFNYFFEPI